MAPPQQQPAPEATDDSAPRATHMDSTDAAFAALLSVPGAEPETGEWHFSVPAEYHGKTEQELIRWLEQKKREGADFNAYRHFGTLLHHAIRAHLQGTALWLLTHGADPRLPVKDYGQYPGQDTLSLAVNYGQMQVAEALKRPPYLMKVPVAVSIKSDADRRSELEQSVQASRAQDWSSPAKVRELIRVVHTGLFPGMQRRFGIYHNDVAKSLTLMNAALAKIPPAVLASALDDDETLKHWFGWSSILAPKDFAEYLKRVPQSALQAHAGAALQGMALHTQTVLADTAQANRALSPENWRQFVARLPQSLDSRGFPPLLSDIDSEFWKPLFDRGFRIRDADAELGAWIRDVSASELENMWPLASAQAPILRQDGIRMALRNFVTFEKDGPQCQGGASIVAKVKFMIAQGVAKPSLDAHPQCLRSPSDIVPQLQALQIFKPLAPPATPRFVAVTGDVHCRFAASDVWYKALVSSVVVPSVQLIEVPGEEQCALLVSRPSGQTSFGGPHDGFTGPDDDPVPSCPDYGPAATSEVWRLNRAGVRENIQQGLDGVDLTGAVRDTADGRQYLLAHTYTPGCKNYPGTADTGLLSWSVRKGQPAISVVDVNNPVWKAYVLQCDPADEEVCPSFERETKQHKPGSGQENGFQAFMDEHWQAEHAAYLKAVRELDKPALKAMEARGIPFWWTREALLAVSNSGQPLAEKRRRMAWLFKNHDQLRKALSWDVINSLKPWLPAEDWWPVQEAWPGVRPNGARHTCENDHAQGLMCGETWTTPSGASNR